MDYGLRRYLLPRLRRQPLDLGYGPQLLQNGSWDRRTVDDHDAYCRRRYRLSQRILRHNVGGQQHGRARYPSCLRSNIIHAHGQAAGNGRGNHQRSKRRRHGCRLFWCWCRHWRCRSRYGICRVFNGGLGKNDGQGSHRHGQTHESRQGSQIGTG